MSNVAGQDAATPQPVHIAVCICTCGRPQGLARLLQALCAQQFDSEPPAVSIVVADNEVSAVNREVCQAAREHCAFPIRYLEAQPAGISFARNACLDRLPSDCTHVAMIDDDEVPVDHWLNALLQAQQRTGADIVVGPTRAVFEADTPDWLIQSGFFDKPPHPDQYSDLEAFPPAATCNVLVRSSVFQAQGFRFDPELALTGSEDKLLFQDLKLKGHRFIWAAAAGAREYVPRHRARLGYALSEAMRRGSTKFYVKIRLKAPGVRKRIQLVMRSTLRAITGIGVHSLAAIVLLPLFHRSRGRIVTHLLRAAENLGFLVGIFGYRRKHYQQGSLS